MTVVVTFESRGFKKRVTVPGVVPSSLETPTSNIKERNDCPPVVSGKDWYNVKTINETTMVEN